MICLKPSSWLASQKVDKNVQLHGRSPYGERGLKFEHQGIPQDAVLSLSLRRAWIEIRICTESVHRITSRSPYGERGLKFACIMLFRLILSRSPYGERGLKFDQERADDRRWCVALLTESVA